MAIPTVNAAAISLIDYAESTTNWSGWGANAGKWGAQSEFRREGSNSVGVQPNATGDGGFGRDSISAFNATTNLVFVWVYVSATTFVGASASYGVYIRLCSTASWTDYYSDYIVGGNDVAWVGAGWHLVALNANSSTGRTADRTGTNPCTLTAVTRVGVGFNFAATASKSTVIAIDVMRYGTKYEVTGVTTGSASLTYNENDPSADTITRSTGSFVTDGFEDGDVIRVSGTTNNNGEYTINTVAATTLTLIATDDLTQEGPVSSYVDGGITLESIYTKDGPTDDSWYGVVSKNRDGQYEVNYPLIVGDESGTNRTFFLSRGDVGLFADQPLAISGSVADLRIETAQDTGANTIFVIGQSSGTDQNRVGFSGSIITQDQTFFETTSNGAALAQVDLSAAIDTMECFGATFLRVNYGVIYAADNSHLLTSTTFDGCGQVNPSQVEARNCTFSGYTGSGGSSGAMAWNASIDVEYCRFLANTDAIWHSAAGSVVYTELKFAGNTYDIHNSSAGTVAVSSNESTASTYRNSGGGSVTITNTKTLVITCTDENGNGVDGARVRIEKQSDNSLVSNGTANSSGVYTDATYNYTVDTPVNVICRLKGYTNYYGQSTITDKGLSVPANMPIDTAVDLP